jgi:hypothetical protein
MHQLVVEPEAREQAFLQEGRIAELCQGGLLDELNPRKIDASHRALACSFGASPLDSSHEGSRQERLCRLLGPVHRDRPPPGAPTW